MAKATEKRRAQSPEQFLKAAESGKLEPVYYFYATVGAASAGDKQKRNPLNDYLLAQALDALRQATVGGARNDFNSNTFVASEAGMEKVLAVAQTYPMMRPKRLVIVKDAQDFRADDWRKAERYLQNPAPTTCLAFIAEHLPTRNKGGDAAKSLVETNAMCVAFAPFFRRQEMAPHLETELRARGLKLAREAEGLLFDLLGFDMADWLQALDKIKLYVAARDTIGVADVQACITRTHAEEIWGLLDAVAEKRLAPALRHLITYLDNGKQEDEILLVGQLIRLFTAMLDARRALDRGIPQAEIVRAIGGNEWAAKKKLAQAQGHSVQALMRSLRALQALDVAIRSSRVPHHAHFERFVLRACGALATR